MPVPTKTLAVVKKDLSQLYDALLAKSIDVKSASELANIAGKILKAEQLELAREVFLSNVKPADTLTIEG